VKTTPAPAAPAKTRTDVQPNRCRLAGGTFVHLFQKVRKLPEKLPHAHLFREKFFTRLYATIRALYRLNLTPVT
jgi:hypothetical protein